MKKKVNLLLVSAILCGSLHAQQEIPNASKFLPGPPDQTSVEYLKDYSKYVWGNTQRTTEEGKEAADDMNYQLSTYVNAFSPLVGLIISKSNTPNIYLVLDYIMTYGQNTLEAAQNSFSFSLRPFAKFKESSLVPSYDSQYSDISSYPSSFAFMGWLTALTLVEICPDKQDGILARGYQFGTNSIISGLNWDSDAESGRMLACALSTLLHNHSNFNNMIKSARTEYEKKTGISNTIYTTDPTQPFFPNTHLPNALKYLPAPPTYESVSFAYDMNQHITNSLKRNTSEGRTAIEDVDYSVDYLCKIYSPAFGMTLSKTATPQIYNLLSRVHDTGKPSWDAVKEYYGRPRPYVLLNEATAYQPDEAAGRTSGSYPSGHTAEGWLIAMVLSEINSKSAEDLLARSYQYGQGRVITGYHWQSDIDAGRLIGSTVYAHLHACDDFMKQMQLAKQEYSGSTGVKSATSEKANRNADIYTLSGMKVDSTSIRSGIYIQGNKKVAYK